jgi:TPP-dependent pyruvate/acetoin dehydrogenase alpha subunit
MIRNAGACHEMGMPLERIFAGYLGTADGPNGGRDGHFGDLARGVLQPISHVGDMVPVTRASRWRSGSGRGARRADVGRRRRDEDDAVHEGLNLAGVLRVPAVFVLQNNQVALGTRLEQHQRRLRRLAGDVRAARRIADGNNVLDVYAATRLAADHARSGGGPTLLVVETFRMGGHATHDEAEARATFPRRCSSTGAGAIPSGCTRSTSWGEGIDRDGWRRSRPRSRGVEAAAERRWRDRERTDAGAGVGGV